MALSESTEMVLGIVALLLLGIPFYAYYSLLRQAHNVLYRKTLRISVLASRTALFLPAYSFCMWLSLVVPTLYLPLQIVISIAEGYCFYGFFAMVVTNLGGGDATAALLGSYFDAGKRPVCPCCCPSRGQVFYRKVSMALWHFLNTRTLFVAITSVLQLFLHYDHKLTHGATTTLKTFTYFFVFISLCFLGNGFGSLVMFFEMLYDASANLGGLYKILLLKFSVGLIVVQGLIEEVLFATGYIKLDDSASFSAQDRGLRIYCFVVVVEYAFLAVAVFYAYSSEIRPRDAHKDPVPNADADGYGVAPADESKMAPADEAERAIDVSFGDYVRMVMALGDVWDGLDLLEFSGEPIGGGVGHGLRQPLTAGDMHAHQYNPRDAAGNVV